MAIGVCLTCMKYTLFSLNFFYWLVGCLLVAMGIWAIADPSLVRDYSYGKEWEAGIFIYSLITVGATLTVTGFVGCCGTIREGRCLLILFFILLFVFNAIFTTAGLYLMIKRESTSEWFPEPKKEDVSKRLYELIKEIDTDPTAKKDMDYLQTKYRCCGADKGKDDYLKSSDLCKRRPLRPCTEEIHKVEKEKHDQTMKKFSNWATILSAILLGISVSMIVGMVITVILCCSLKNELIDSC